MTLQSTNSLGVVRLWEPASEAEEAKRQRQHLGLSLSLSLSHIPRSRRRKSILRRLRQCDAVGPKASGAAGPKSSGRKASVAEGPRRAFAAVAAARSQKAGAAAGPRGAFAAVAPGSPDAGGPGPLSSRSLISKGQRVRTKVHLQKRCRSLLQAQISLHDPENGVGLSCRSKTHTKCIVVVGLSSTSVG